MNSEPPIVNIVYQIILEKTPAGPFKRLRIASILFPRRTRQRRRSAGHRRRLATEAVDDGKPRQYIFNREGRARYLPMSERDWSGQVN